MTTRRRFLARTSAGLAAVALAPGLWACGAGRQLPAPRAVPFRPYRPGQTPGPVQIVTPPGVPYTTTYYDVQPWSPSGRYLALTRLPFQDRIARLGDVAQVAVVDLQEQTVREVYPTRSWGYQLGASVHWGATDDVLYFNDVIEDAGGVDGATRTVAVRLDLATGQALAFGGPMIDVDPATGRAVGPTIEYLNLTQYSYGTPAADPDALPAPPVGPADDDGVWASTAGGPRRLVLSVAALAEAVGEPAFYQGARFTVFHTKLNPQGDRMLVVFRADFDDQAVAQNPDRRGRNSVLLTARADGSDLQVAVPRERWTGHHPTWHPDGRRIVMNLAPTWQGDDTLRFTTFEPDGSDFTVLAERVVGSGHPTVTPDTRTLLSDAYPMEPMADRETGEVPVRLIDLPTQTEREVCRVFTDLGRAYDVRRYWGPSKLDAHPAWNRDYTQVCFNGAPEGVRQVLIADLSGVL